MTLAPIERTERIRGIDIARGVALLGIILVNARFFFAPIGVGSDIGQPLTGMDRSGADVVAAALVDILCSYKFISLFSMLFGFGIAMQASRAAAAGESRWPGGLRRLAMLGFVGIVHATLVWYGDILTLYAMLGLVVLAVCGLPRRTVGWICVGLAGVCFLIALLGAGLMAIGSMKALVPGAADSTAPAAAGAEVQRGFAAMLAAGFDPGSPVWMAGETVAYREGPFLDALLFRVAGFALGMVFALFSYGWQSLLMMVCGVYAFKAGLFGSEGSARRRALALPLLGAGLAISSAAVLPGVFLGTEQIAGLIAFGVLLPVGAMVLPFAYAAIVIEWGPRLPAAIATALERTGRMSFTVYLSESIVCTALSYWWGLAWFGTLGDAQAALTVFLVWLGLVCFATAWLAVFRIGPFEWLWRKATYAGGAGPPRSPRPNPA